MNLTPTPTTGRAWLSAEFCEWVLMPLLVAYALGLVTADLWAQQRVTAATTAAAAAVADARQQVERVNARLQLYAQACEPLLSWPVEATPMLFDGPARRTGAQP